MKLELPLFLASLASTAAFSPATFVQKSNSVQNMKHDLNSRNKMARKNQNLMVLKATEDEQSAEAEDTTKLAQTLQVSDAEIVVAEESSELAVAKNENKLPQGEAYKQGIFSGVPKLITMDAVGTVIQLRSEVGMFYRDILMEATEFNARLPSPAHFTRAFREAFKEQDKEYPCFGCGQGLSSKDWWRTVVRNTYAKVEEIDYEEGLREELNGWLGEAVFEALYTDVFTTSEAWELKSGVLEALSRFTMWREEGSGPQIALLTNSDERMHSIIYNLGIADAFDFILTSREIGSAKPARSAFEVAMSRLGLTNPSECMHIGDAFSKDIVGASKAGWHAVYIPETGEHVIPEGTDPDLVFSMLGDLYGVLHMYGLEPEYRLIQTTRNIDERGNFMDHQKVWSLPGDKSTESEVQELPAAPKSWEGPGRF